MEFAQLSTVVAGTNGQHAFTSRCLHCNLHGLTNNRFVGAVHHDFVVIASGRLREQKGFEFLLRSFNKVIKNNQQFILHILGEDDNNGLYKKELNSLSKTLGIANNVVFHGFVQNPFLYYKYADLFVLSSKWEGLPNVILEALFVQTPVVVTDCIPYFHEILEESKNGFIVNYGDEQAFADRIMQYKELNVNSDVVNMPDYDKFFLDLVTKSFD